MWQLRGWKFAPSRLSRIYSRLFMFIFHLLFWRLCVYYVFVLCHGKSCEFVAESTKASAEVAFCEATSSGYKFIEVCGENIYIFQYLYTSFHLSPFHNVFAANPRMVVIILISSFNVLIFYLLFWHNFLIFSIQQLWLVSTDKFLKHSSGKRKKLFTSGMYSYTSTIFIEICRFRIRNYL